MDLNEWDETVDRLKSVIAWRNGWDVSNDAPIVHMDLQVLEYSGN